MPPCTHERAVWCSRILRCDCWPETHRVHLGLACGARSSARYHHEGVRDHTCFQCLSSTAVRYPTILPSSPVICFEQAAGCKRVTQGSHIRGTQLLSDNALSHVITSFGAGLCSCSRLPYLETPSATGVIGDEIVDPIAPEHDFGSRTRYVVRAPHIPAIT